MKTNFTLQNLYKSTLLLIAGLFISAVLSAQAVFRVKEVNTSTNQIELINLGDMTDDIGSYWLCLGPGTYVQVSNATSGSTNLAPGESVTVNYNINPTADGFSLFSIPSFSSSDPSILVDYVQWGAANQSRVGQAVTAGVWDSASNFVSGDSPYVFTGSAADFGSTFWESEDLCFPGAFPAVDEASLTTSVGGSSIATSWDAVVGQIGCQIQVRLAGGNILGAQIIGGVNANSFNIPGSVLQVGTNYEWRVRCGCSQSPLVAGPFSSWQPFTTPGSAVIAVSPNPTEGQSFATFNVAEEGQVALEVYDLSGRMVGAIFSGIAQPNNDYRFEFNGSSLPNGIYIYRLTTETEVQTEKVIISR